MIFQKKCRKSLHTRFVYKRNEIEKVNEYTYLGIKITCTGNFAAAEDALKDKALHALYASKRLVNFSFLKPKIAEKLFDTLIKPIVLYGSEVWGAYSKGNFGSWDKTATEKVHLRFCKLYLGVNSKCSNDASRAELGRMPLKLTVDRQIMNFYNHLNTMETSTIAKQALEISKHISIFNKKCFFSYYRELLQTYNNAKDISSKSNINMIYEKLKENYYVFWKNKIQNSTKLEFFASLKSSYDQEHYLSSIRHFKYRQALTKLRLSNHSLMIEVGRYKQPIIPREQRICSLCILSKVENEYHFLFECPAYDIHRRKFFEDLDINFSNRIKQFTNDSKFKCLMETENDHQLFLLAKYIQNLFNHRNNSINPE